MFNFMKASAVKADVTKGPANVFVGVSDECPAPVAANFLGYTEEGVEFSYQDNADEIRVHEEIFPIDDEVMTAEGMVKVNLAQNSITNLARVIASADNSVPGRIMLGEGEITYRSLLIETTAPGQNGGIRQILLPKVKAQGAIGQAMKKGKVRVLPAEFAARAPEKGQVIYIIDLWDETIDTGALAYVATKPNLRVAGEGDAADALLTMSGGTEDDEVVLQIADAANAITVTHDDSTGHAFELTGAENFVMDDLRDWLWLKHDGTSWIEQGRFDASA